MENDKFQKWVVWSQMSTIGEGLSPNPDKKKGQE